MRKCALQGLNRNSVHKIFSSILYVVEVQFLITQVPYVTNGRNSQIGHDGHFNILKKKRSTVLKENLQSVIEAKSWEAEVIVDVNHGDLQSLKREGVNLFLIPEDIARYIDYSSVNKDECFELTHDEYESGNIDRVVKYIEEN